MAELEAEGRGTMEQPNHVEIQGEHVKWCFQICNTQWKADKTGRKLEMDNK